MKQAQRMNTRHTVYHSLLDYYATVIQVITYQSSISLQKVERSVKVKAYKTSLGIVGLFTFCTFFHRLSSDG